MARISVNPSAEVSSFSLVKAGTYRLRVESVSDEKTSQAGNTYLSWRLAIVTPKSELMDIDGKPLSGAAASIFYTTVLDEDKQGMLRGLVEATLGEWREFDTDELFGKEFDGVVDEDTYDGKTKNVVKSILK